MYFCNFWGGARPALFQKYFIVILFFVFPEMLRFPEFPVRVFGIFGIFEKDFRRGCSITFGGRPNP
jgi:hypothetical protein